MLVYVKDEDAGKNYIVTLTPGTAITFCPKISRKAMPVISIALSMNLLVMLKMTVVLSLAIVIPTCAPKKRWSISTTAI